MEYDFQSAVNGVLEWESRNPNIASTELTSALEKSLNETFEYYEKSIKAKYALERVLFRAWYNRDGYYTDFSVSRYKRGLHCSEFVQLMKYFDLQDITMTRLYARPPEEAIIILGDIMDADRNSASQYALQYLRISAAITNTDLRVQSLRYLVHHDALKSTDGSVTLQTLILLREQLLALRDRQQDTVIHALVDIISAIFTLADRKVLESVPVQHVLRKIVNDGNHSSFAVLSEYISSNLLPSKTTIMKRLHMTTEERPVKRLKQEWKETATHITSEKSIYIRHTQAFVKIYQHIQRHTLPIPSLAARETNKSSYQTLSDDAYNAIVAIINRRQDDIELIECKQKCLQILYGQYPGWKSIFKAMVQFADLWIEEFSLPQASAEFICLLCNERLERDYFLCFVKVAFGHPSVDVPRNKTGKMFNFLTSIARSMEDRDRLLAFRDYTFSVLTKSWPHTYNLASLVQESKLDVHKEFTKVCNKFISESKESENEPLAESAPAIKDLVILSILYPYGVVYHLVSLSLQNKKQTDAIVSTLRQLGSLCRLTARTDGGTVALLNICLQDAINNISDEMLESHLPRIKKFISEASHCKGDMEYIPPMMLLGGESDEYMEILLDIDNLADSVARSLKNCYSSVNNRRNRTTLRLCLEVMDTLYSPKSTHSKSYREIVDQAHSEYALVPTMRLVARHTHFISLLSALQSQQRRGKLVIHEHELIAHIRDGISIILGKYLYEPTLRRILKETLVDLSTLDWQASLMWFGLQRALFNYPNDVPHPPPAVVPKAIENLVGTLGNKIKGSPGIVHEDGWLALLEACVLSQDFTATLFQEKDKWMYNLLLLWKHPNEDEILVPRFYTVLRSYSTERNYYALMIDFLSRLFDSFEGAADIIRDYQYSAPEMQRFAKDLRDSEAKILFICLYAVRLFNESCKEDMVDLESKFYSSDAIAKALQNCLTWTVIDQERAYTPQRMKELALTDTIAKANLATDFQDDGGEDMNNDMPVTQIEQSTTETSNEPEQQRPTTSIVHLYFPFYTNQVKSFRALNILVLYLLLFVCIKLGTVTDSLRVLIFQVVEGLCDDSKRRLFREVADKQTKVQKRNWRNAEGRKVKVLLRPILNEQETKWISPLVKALPDTKQADALISTLELFYYDDGPEQRERNSSDKQRAIYLKPKANK